MSSIDENLVFDGLSGLSGGAFFRSVRQQSLAKGNQDDDRWIAQLAAGYFDGPALDWYEELEEETQESWKLLRRALLQRWPTAQKSSPDLAASTYIPASVPAAAPARTVALIAAAPPALRSQSQLSYLASAALPGGLTGRVRANLESDNSFVGYVSRYQDPQQDLYLAQSIADATTVQVQLDRIPHKMMMLTRADEWLGVIFPRISAESPSTGIRFGTLAPMKRMTDPYTNVTTFVAPEYHKGPSEVAGFNILVDGSILFTWSQQHRNDYILYPLLRTYRNNPDLKEIFLSNIGPSGNDDVLKKEHLTRMRLFFERT